MFDAPGQPYTERTTKPATPPPVNAFARKALAALDELEIRRVGDEDREALMRFRYDCYRAAGHVGPCESRRIEDDYDDAPGVMRFALVHGGRVVSSVRLNFVDRTQRRSMSVSTFPDVLHPMLDMGFTVIDPTRFTIDPSVSRDLPALPYLTLRVVVMAATHFGSDYTLSLIRPAHAAFYKRIFGAAELADARECSNVSFPVCLLATDMELCLAQMCRKYPFFHAMPEECETLFGPASPTTRTTSATARTALGV